MKNKALRASTVRKALLLFFALALLAVEIGYRALDLDGYTPQMIYFTATRFAGAAICVIFMLEFSFTTVMHPLGNKRGFALLLTLPAFAVAINNFPFVSFFSDDCGLDASVGKVLLYALFCFSVGFFEEIAFRGCVFMYLLRKRRTSRKGIFMAIFWSSVVFGLIHLVNLATSSPVAVLLQIGYSSLIGALCSLVLLATKNIWLCVLLHSTYNFVGNVIPELGFGVMWTVPQMIFTAIIAVIVTGYSIWLFFKLPLKRAEEIYEK